MLLIHRTAVLHRASIVLVVSEHGPCQEPLQIQFFKRSLKAYSLEHVVMKSSLQECSQGLYSLYELQVFNDHQVHPAQTFLVFSTVFWSCSPSVHLVIHP
jgi:capsule polysaccharide modification protein KpsS